MERLTGSSWLHAAILRVSRSLSGVAASRCKVYGLSTQNTEYQGEAVRRLKLPFALLSAAGEFSKSLQLPWFEVEGMRLLKRLTLILAQGRILHCVYPVFPPDEDAERVIEWIRRHARLTNR